MAKPEDRHTDLGKPGSPYRDGRGDSGRIPLGEGIPVSPPVFPTHGRALASQWARLAAVIIDLAICAGFITGVVTIGEAAYSPSTVEDIFHPAIWVVLIFGYSPLFTYLWGGTLGKVVLRIRVVRELNGSPLSYWRALGRHLAHVAMQFIPVLNFIDSLFCTWDKPLRQCLHDKAADTVVVKR
ncbi:RDD family protein [Streptomyces sp. NPDC058665]|uniref:RDD family protein n=1 Tax=Streptomyces sp. NPDC058665 TaxID=3346586 RepID=UPI00364B3D45